VRLSCKTRKGELRVTLTGLNKLPAEQREQLKAYVLKYSSEIKAALGQYAEPGQCESCPASAVWDYAQYANQGLLCFYSAYFRGRSGPPTPCSTMRANCPRKERR
jgi:hypothetical protein